MALTDCPECGHQVSDTAQACPNCGHHLGVAPESETAGSPASTALIFSIVGAAGIIIGSLLPWVSIRTIFGTISASGTDGDGVLTLIAGVIIGAVAGVSLSRRSSSRVTGVAIIALGAVSGLIAVNVFSNLAGTADLADEGVFSTVGGGLWLVIIGAATTIGSGFSVFAGSSEGSLRPRSALAGVGVGVAVIAAMLVALAVFAGQSAEDTVAQTFEDIASQLEGS